ncbi:MAG: hypothetical protein QGG89_16605, partial [Vicinamibacterales bacterium]|nr:hypothetical protein [Vicinamibacterales bacterium]
MKQTTGCLAAAVVALTSHFSSLHAARAVATVVENRMTWSADGRIEATCHETEGIGGVVGNWGPDPVRYRRIGQTFRCPGPRLAAVQLGIDDFATGQPGLCFTEPVTPVILSLRRGGPDGQVVAKTTIQPAGWGTRAVLKTDQPSDPSVLWYAEVRPQNPNAAGGKMWVTSTSYDVYPHGRMYMNGTPRDSDLHLRVTRSWTARAQRPGKVVFWAARPGDRIWMEPKDTAGLMLADDPTQPVRLTAARNERVSAQLIATPDPNYRIRTAALSLGPLEGPGGARIQPQNVRIEWLRYSKNYWNKKTDGLLFPDPLAPTATAGDIAGRPDKALNTAFWLSIRIPTGIPAGLYKATAVLVVNGGLILRRRVELEVFDFDLPKQTHTRCGLFHGMGFTEERHLWFIEDLADFRLEIDSPFYASLLGALRDENRFNEAGYAFTLGTKMQKALITAGTRINELGQKVCVVTPWGDTYRAFRGEKGA